MQSSPPTKGTQATSSPLQSCSPVTSPLTQGTCLRSCMQSSPLMQDTDGTSSLMQSCRPLTCSSPTQDNGHHQLSHSECPTQGTSPPTQGTSHPPSLPPDQGHLHHYNHASNFPVSSDAAKRTIRLADHRHLCRDMHSRISATTASANRTINLQKPHRNSLQTSDTLLNAGLRNRTNISGINTAVTPLVTALPISKSVYTQPASVTTPFTKPNTDVCSASYSGNIKEAFSTAPSLVSGSATLLIMDHGSTP